MAGHGSLPPPKRLTFDQIASGTEDCRYAEITGIVREGDARDRQSQLLVLNMGNGSVEVSMIATNEPALIAK